MSSCKTPSEVFMKTWGSIPETITGRHAQRHPTSESFNLLPDDGIWVSLAAVAERVPRYSRG